MDQIKLEPVTPPSPQQLLFEEQPHQHGGRHPARQGGSERSASDTHVEACAGLARMRLLPGIGKLLQPESVRGLPARSLPAR